VLAKQTSVRLALPPSSNGNPCSCAHRPQIKNQPGTLILGNQPGATTRPGQHAITAHCRPMPGATPDSAISVRVHLPWGHRAGSSHCWGTKRAQHSHVLHAHLSLNSQHACENISEAVCGGRCGATLDRTDCRSHKLTKPLWLASKARNALRLISSASCAQSRGAINSQSCGRSRRAVSLDFGMTVSSSISESG
jgi:hypothetical protein